MPQSRELLKYNVRGKKEEKKARAIITIIEWNNGTTKSWVGGLETH